LEKKKSLKGNCQKKVLFRGSEGGQTRGYDGEKVKEKGMTGREVECPGEIVQSARLQSPVGGNVG